MLFLARRYKIYKQIIIDGYAQVPYLYFTLGLFAFASVGVWYRAVTQFPAEEHNTFRFKNQYTVVRPDDPRLANYPRKYLTELRPA